MSNRILYHGSVSVIEHPVYGKGKSYNDYGRGFYCTEHSELAGEWACTEGVDGYVNAYEMETDGLKILDLLSEEYHILNWLALLLFNRKVRMSTPVMKRGTEYLIRNFLPEYEESDIIIGYRADDSYFSFARAFVGNEISLAQLKRAMHLGKLGEQFVLKSEKAFQSIYFTGYTVADSAIYYPKRKSRDDEARKAYAEEAKDGDAGGIFMLDILREEMRADDDRLR